MNNLDITQFTTALQNSGIDTKLISITEQVATELSTILDTDIAASTPSSLKSILQASTDAIADVTNTLHEATEALKPDLTSLQEEMGKVLSGSVPPNSLQGLLDSVANDIAIPSIESLQDSLGSAINAPQLTGLEAFANEIQGTVAGSEWTDPTGALRRRFTETTEAASATAFDPGTLIPNFKFKTEPTFDEDGVQNGERLVAFKFGNAAVQPIKDALSEVIPEPYEVEAMAATIKNELLEDKGVSIATLGPVINKFKERLATEVKFDPSTGENFVFQKTIDEDGAEILIPFGFASKEDWEESFKQGRAAAQGMMQVNAGALKKFIGENTEVAQDTFKRLSEIDITIPTSENISEGAINEFAKDPTTGLAVNFDNIMNAFGPTIESAKKAAPGVEANLKELDSNFKNFFTQLGKELPPGQKPEPFVDPEEGAE
tara:strand:+ start:261 stop:1559 length:1299 start_codon:yes stop_codon:yes gene_type:complete